jgi:hypothetical protein
VFTYVNAKFGPGGIAMTKPSFNADNRLFSKKDNLQISDFVSKQRKWRRENSKEFYLTFTQLDPEFNWSSAPESQKPPVTENLCGQPAVESVIWA